MTPRAVTVGIMEGYLVVSENKFACISDATFAGGKPDSGKNEGLDPSTVSY